MPVLDNPKHELFALELAKGASTKKKAAKKAGYTGDNVSVTASKLLNESKIIDRIKELQNARAKRFVLSEHQKREILANIATGRTKSTRKVVKDGKDGREITVERAVSNADRRAAIAELNKVEGAYPVTTVEVRQIGFVMNMGGQLESPAIDVQPIGEERRVMIGTGSASCRALPTKEQLNDHELAQHVEKSVRIDQGVRSSKIDGNGSEAMPPESFRVRAEEGESCE